ncbi:NAD-dependent epimerase/dehydratase family protein [Chloroflexi bacterium TSY]|nr:NAD-dependent epimerase/dehydratase family protein [Chloroflexi bacterium TSY]
MKTILITGASGFIAQYLAKKLKNAHYRVIGVSRTNNSLDNFDLVYKGKLGTPIAHVFETQ